MNKVKQNINKILSIAMAILVMIATTGFTIYSHHCYSSNVHNYSVLIQAEECTHKVDLESNCVSKLPECCTEKSIPIEKDCCENNIAVKKLVFDSVLFQSAPTLKVIEFNICDQSLLTIYNLALLALQNSYQIQNAPPPSKVPDYLSLIQVYLI